MYFTALLNKKEFLESSYVRWVECHVLSKKSAAAIESAAAIDPITQPTQEVSEESIRSKHGSIIY